jgi:O-methyltransferase
MSQRITLLSDQVDAKEVAVILRELEAILKDAIPGDITEFGCYVGTTSVFLAERLKRTTRKLYLYDSFEGLPPKTREDESPAGMQFTTGELLATKKQLLHNLKRANVPPPYIKKGWFSDLTEKDIPERIAYAFLDGDYYHSVRDPLALIWNHLAPGATIVVDDYANEALPGAAKAVDEWLRMHPAKFRVEHSLGIIHT